MTAHAYLSASGAYRWLICTPSAKLGAQFDDVPSAYAAEGSFAHAVAELRLKKYLGLIKTKAFNAQRKLQEGSQYYSAEMADYIEGYVAVVAERISQAQTRSSDAIILLEQRLDFSEWVPQGFGTGDVVIIADGILDVIDLKYGKGVPVSAVDNPQMRLYGLGALSQFEMLYDIQAVRMTIIQPRLDSISEEDMPVDELVKWAEDYLKPRAEMAIKGEGDFCAGEHCKFCKARFVCKARADYNMELAKHDFCDSFLLTHDDIADVLARADNLAAWVSDIKEYALQQALDGVKFPGWKLVSGRSNRKYSDDCEVAEILVKADYPEEKIYKPSELLGITAMEKELGKKRFNELLAGLLVKPPGKPTLVPESDKRPEISSTDSAKTDFQQGGQD